jgi:hypothetical protein
MGRFLTIYQQTDKRISNLSLGDNALKEVSIADGEDLEGLNMSSNLQKIEEATDFDNAVHKFATKNSNLISNSAGRGRDCN